MAGSARCAIVGLKRLDTMKSKLRIQLKKNVSFQNIPTALLAIRDAIF